MFKLSVLTRVCFLGLMSVAAVASGHTPKIIWTAVFSHIQPARKGVSIGYCKSHTPTVIVTSIKEIMSHAGVQALNSVNLRYLSYRTTHKDGLFFNVVNAVVSGHQQGEKPWSTPMKLYEQTLADAAVTYTVWSTKDCKGTFLGTPTQLAE
jgi:hypothetical protein